MKRAFAWLLLLGFAACRAPVAHGVERIDLHSIEAPRGPKILCVVAHPDDEIAFAATLYQTAVALGGACDVAVITNGEGGFKYATLSEPIYGLELTDETVGRARLPAIRRRELAAGCRILGVRDLYFLDQTDHRYTLDPNEVLAPDADVWDLAFVERSLRSILRAGDYDFLFTLVPSAGTHAHHKAAGILALRVLDGMPPRERPVAMCSSGSDAETFGVLEGFPITRVTGECFSFDRTRPLGFQGGLDYKIVVNWAIAEHKSQGTMQRLMNQGDREGYRLYALNAPDAVERARAFFEALAVDPFEARSYGPSAGTNTDG